MSDYNSRFVLCGIIRNRKVFARSQIIADQVIDSADFSDIVIGVLVFAAHVFLSDGPKGVP
jgi:hypothetical protein